MSLPEALAWIALFLVAWFWYDSAGAREAAVAAARAACDADGLQFLDDTVAIVRIWPGRDGDGQLRLQRVYGFEYSDTGDNRRGGSIVVLGRRVVAIRT
ncbi:MAG TPA: DUF3301 domain-containing protein [Rhodocyclaceae bacterium]|nr:DUF3301 domain-containing protein [Rhodocyclaceae bacterium]